MVLGINKLLQLVHDEQLVLHLSERELTNPEGCGFDLRMGKVHTLEGEGYLGVTERKTPDSTLVMEYDPNKQQVFTLKPGQSVLVTTIESVTMPENLTALVQPRSTLYRSGVIMRGGNVAPGYVGQLSFLLFNSHTQSMQIELGARIVHILFFQIDGSANKYRGQWAKGRVTVSTKEKQV